MSTRIHGVWSSVDHDNPEDHKKINDYLASEEFTPKQYVGLLAGDYKDHDADKLKELFGDREAREQDLQNKIDWSTRGPEAKRELELGTAFGSLRHHPHNNPENNTKALRYLKDRYLKTKETDQYAEHARHRYRIHAILSGGNLHKDQMVAWAQDPEFANYILGDGNNESNPRFDKAAMDQLVNESKPSEITNLMVQHPAFDERHARKMLRSKDKIDHVTGKALAAKDLIDPKSAERFLEEHSKDLTTHYMDQLLEKLTPAKRKQYIDDKIGITGGRYSDPPPDDEDTTDQERREWKENNWDNWSKGPGAFTNPKIVASSKFLTEDHVDHIKRHGDLDERLALFENPNVDPHHGAEMWEKWYNNDDHHGYDLDKWREKYKEDHEDDWYEEFQEVGRERAEEEYTLDDHIRDSYDGRAYDKDYIHQHIFANPHKFDTVHDNPDFDESKPEHPEDNPRHIDFADQYSGGGHSYEFQDHPDYDDMMDQAHQDLVESEGYPDSVYDSYSDAISDSEYSHAREAWEESLDEFYLYPSNIPAHLKNKIPALENHEQHKLNKESGSALTSLGLDEPYRDQSKPFGTRDIQVPDQHQYGPNLHHHEMVKQYADANGGKIDLGTLVKRHPNLKDRIKHVMGDKQSITSQEVQQKIDQIPKQSYRLSYRTWGKDSMQNINGQNQMVMRLDHTPESYKQFEHDPALRQTFQKVQELSMRSRHPTNKDSIAWARVDTTNDKHWMIDEVQSDFGSALRHQIESAEEGDPIQKATLLDHLKKIEDAHQDWRENIVNAVIKMARRHGVEKISTHSPESKAAHTGAANVHTVYKDSYQKIPRQLGFKPVESTELPLNERGKKTFLRSRAGAGLEDIAEEARASNRTADEHIRILHHDAMEHHMRQGKIHDDAVKFIESGHQMSLFPTAALPSGFAPGDKQHHEAMWADHRRLFQQHKAKAMQHDPTDRYSKNVQFGEYQTKEPTAADFAAAKETFTSSKPVAHHGDKLLDESKPTEQHQGHQLDLRPEFLKKNEDEMGIGSLLALRLLEIM